PTLGIVPANAGTDFSRHPIGSGPFRFVSQTQDEEASLERNPGYDPGPPPFISRVRFRVVPDAVVRALELRKGSADIEMSSLSPDIIPILARRPELEVTDRPGTNPTTWASISKTPFFPPPKSPKPLLSPPTGVGKTKRLNP